MTRNTRAFRVLVRNSLFRRVTLASLRRTGDLGDLDGGDGWTAGAWAEALDGYFEQHDEIGTGPDARGPSMLIIEEGKTAWAVRQIFDDPAGTTTGASRPPSTSPPPTRKAPRSSTSPTSASSSPPANPRNPKPMIVKDFSNVKDFRSHSANFLHAAKSLHDNQVKSNDLGDRQLAPQPLQSIAFGNQVAADFKEPAGVTGHDLEYRAAVAAADFLDDRERGIETIERPAYIRPFGHVLIVGWGAMRDDAAVSDASVVARLRAAGCVFAEDEAAVLLSTARSPAELGALVERRAAGEPLEQVVGWAEFAGLRIGVDPGVFVPRRRSEFLVSVAVGLGRSRMTAAARPP